MDDLLLHNRNRRELAQLAADPPQALLLLGPRGFGKRSVALAWAGLIAPVAEVLQPDDKGTIGIESVRNLYRRTRGKQADRQVVIVDQAQSMGLDAQNAFLKLLEEPRPGVTFVLCAPTIDTLLPTIVSRLQVVQLHELPDTQLSAWAMSRQKIDTQTMAQLLFVAKGRPGTLATLIGDTAAFDHQRELMRLAKQLLGASRYERLSAIAGLTKNRADLVATLEAMAHMASLRMSKGDDSLVALADAAQTCLARLAQNANPRAQLLRFFLSY